MLAFGGSPRAARVLQAVDAARYTALGESQRVRAVVLPAERGSIFDRNGADLALTVPQKTVWADPHLIDRSAAGGEPARAGARRRRRPLQPTRLGSTADFVYVARQVDDTSRTRRGAAPPRRVPHRRAGRFARRATWPLGPRSRRRRQRRPVGLEGSTTSGSPACRALVREHDPRGPHHPRRRQSVEPAQPGDDLVLTIDRSMQYETEQACCGRSPRSEREGGTAIVHDRAPARSSPWRTSTAIPTPASPSASGNKALTTVFEPGSVNKVITVSAALEEGLVNPDTRAHVPDRLQVSRPPLHRPRPAPRRGAGRSPTSSPSRRTSARS